VRTSFIALLLAFPLCALIVTVIFGSSLASFNRQTPELRTPLDMQRFKSVVAWQMRAALVQIAVLLAPWPVFLIGLILGHLRPADFLYILIPSLAVIVAGLLYKNIERRTQAIPAAPEFEDERRHVIHTWMKRPFPDW
jgi:hypothetical protein